MITGISDRVGVRVAEVREKRQVTCQRKVWDHKGAKYLTQVI